MLLISVLFIGIDVLSRNFVSSKGSFDKRFPVEQIRKPHPYIMFKGEENGPISRSERLNSMGYRGKEPAKNKKSGEFRIFVMGGSTVFDGEPPIPQLLEEQFKKNGFFNVNVYNFGVVSSTSKMELARILFEVSDYKPDLIVFYNGANNITHPYYWDPRPGYPFNFVAYENNVLLKDIKNYPAFLLLCYKSNLLRILFHKQFIERFADLDKTRNEVGYDSERWRKNIALEYVTSLNKARIIANSYRAKFIVFFQPMVYFKKELSAKENELVDSLVKQHHSDVREKIILYSKLYGRNLEFVDLSEVYNNYNQQLFMDIVHTNQYAKEIIAPIIYQHILSNIEMPK